MKKALKFVTIFKKLRALKVFIRYGRTRSPYKLRVNNAFIFDYYMISSKISKMMGYGHILFFLINIYKIAAFILLIKEEYSLPHYQLIYKFFLYKTNIKVDLLTLSLEDAFLFQISSPKVAYYTYVNYNQKNKI